MTEEDKKTIINSNKKKLDEIYEHTEYKIKYIKKYVEYWLYVVANYDRNKTINFVDCMCNAGIYSNGVFGTPVEVLKLFISFAKLHPDKQFNLFLNDFNSDRVDIIKEICEKLEYEKINNINVYFSNEDVNEYLDKITSLQNFFGNKGFGELTSTILFVDPYCFGEVKINKIKKFLDTYYAELIFNYFNSDYRRNIDNVTTPQKRKKIIDSMDGIDGYKSDMDEKQLESLIRKELKGKYIKHSFSYPFRIKTNVELYHIIFATPNQKGLIKLKESLWDVFNGDTFFKNNLDENQLTLFDDNEVQRMNVQNFSKEAQVLLYNKYSNQTISYDEIRKFVLESTMLKESHIIKYLLVPLIEDGKIMKNNIKNKRNYKEDTYKFL